MLVLHRRVRYPDPRGRKCSFISNFWQCGWRHEERLDVIFEPNKFCACSRQKRSWHYSSLSAAPGLYSTLPFIKAQKHHPLDPACGEVSFEQPFFWQFCGGRFPGEWNVLALAGYNVKMTQDIFQASRTYAPGISVSRYASRCAPLQGKLDSFWLCLKEYRPHMDWIRHGLARCVSKLASKQEQYSGKA